MRQNFITILAFVMIFSSCNDDALFEKEMYKNVVALISSDYYNTFKEVVPLSPDGEAVTGYIAACSGGTHAPSKDMVIGLEEDGSALEFYNKSLYDLDETRYAKFLSGDKYEIVDYTIRINAGERTGRTMIKIHPEGLSPDSTYFIGLKATDISGVELNESKNTILYQVLIKNEYATQGENVFYSMSGLADGMATAGNKKMFPLTHNSVRMIAGTESFESEVEHIGKTAIVLEVGADNHVTIKPYKDIEVTQIEGDPKYPNIFKVEETFGRTYNVFLLSYQYTVKGVKRHMQEELRLEISN